MASDKRMQPLIISIGIDGGSWKIIDEGIRRGYIKFIPLLAKYGCTGVLKSIPPITYPQWYVLLSGFNPGNIGVFSFIKYDRNRNKISITSHEDFKSPMIGNFLTKTGIRFAIINTPGIIPRSNHYYGYIVGDPFLPLPKYYPSTLSRSLLLVNYKNYDFRISKSMIKAFSKDEILKIAKNLIASRFKLAKYLLKKDRKIRFIHLTIFVNDNLQHFFGISNEITLHLWSYIDLKIKEMLQFIEREYQENYIINIISDHGFDNVHTVYNIGRDLVNKKYMKVKTNSISRIMSTLGINRTNIGKIINKPIIGNVLNTLLRSNRIREFAQKIIPDITGDDPLASIDLRKSKVVYVNMGLYIVNKNIRTREIINELFKYFINIKTPSNEKIFCLVASKDTVFHGRYINYAPDIILIPQHGIHLANKTKHNDIFWSPIFGIDWLADHTPDAIFITYGPRLASSCKVTGNTMDYTPTLLELFGVYSTLKSESLDGKPLKEVINKYEI